MLLNKHVPASTPAHHARSADQTAHAHAQQVYVQLTALSISALLAESLKSTGMALWCNGRIYARAGRTLSCPLCTFQCYRSVQSFVWHAANA